MDKDKIVAIAIKDRPDFSRGLFMELSRADEEMIYHAEREVLNLGSETSCLENIDTYLQRSDVDTGSAYQSVPQMNTYPNGIKTDKIYPKYQNICRGKMQLKGNFTRMDKQCRRMIKAFSGDPNTHMTVMLITDKWNPKSFEDYEEAFIDYAVNYGICFIFLLVTDYGYTWIPFLPYYSSELKALKGMLHKNSLSYEELLDKMDDEPVIYRSSPSTWLINLEKPQEYVFDFRRLRWEKYGGINGREEGRIPLKAARRALSNFDALLNTGAELKPSLSARDAGFYSFDFNGKHIEWTGAELAVNEQSVYSKITEELSVLIAACK